MTRQRPLTKTHGGKYYLAPWIISHFPPVQKYDYYIEPCVGGGSILLNMPRHQHLGMVASDLNYRTIELLRVVRDCPQQLRDILSRLQYCKETFQSLLHQTYQPYQPIRNAARTYAVRRMSRGGLGRSFAWSNRQRGGKPGDVNAWNTSLQNIISVSVKLVGVVLEHSDVFDVFATWQHSYNYSRRSLIYLDPPYLQTTRTVKKAYTYEFTQEQHERLAQLCNKLSSYIVISGYMSDLYQKLYPAPKWRCVQKEMPNHASQQKHKSKRIECLWMNY